VEEKPTTGSPIFGTFPSDRIPMATKDGKVHIHSFTFRDGLTTDNAWQLKHVNYTRTREFRERFEATTCKYHRKKKTSHLVCFI